MAFRTEEQKSNNQLFYVVFYRFGVIQGPYVTAIHIIIYEFIYKLSLARLNLPSALLSQTLP